MAEVRQIPGRGYAVPPIHREQKQIPGLVFYIEPAIQLPHPPAIEKYIPDIGDWVDEGTILSPVVSTWEEDFAGAFSPCFIKEFNDGDLILGYIACEGPRASDGGPKHRALGIAISDDGGTTWVKSGSNPVLTHLPTPGEEEGIFTAGALIDGETLYVWAGCMTEDTPGFVDDDIKVAVSVDRGETFTAFTTVIAAIDDDFVGGDSGTPGELDPFGVFRHTDGLFHMYYSVAGSDGLSWAIVYVSLTAFDTADNTTDILVSGGNAAAGAYFGGADPIFISPTKVCMFLSRGIGAGGGNLLTTNKKIQVVVFDPDNPTQWNTERWYDFGHINNQTTFYSESKDKWFMAYMHHSDKTIELKTYSATAEAGVVIPLARYYIDEAASGQSPTEVEDDANDPEHLAISYDGADPSYVAPATGRGLDWAVDTSDGIVSLTNDDSKVDLALEQTIKCTLELVAKIEDAASGSSRIFGVQEATESGKLAILANPTDHVIRFYWGSAGNILAGVWNDAWSESTPVRNVYHLVLDTSLAVAADRVVLYRDGSLVTKASGTDPSQFDRIQLSSGAKIVIGNREGLQRAVIGEVYYAAFYGVAFTTAQVTAQEAILSVLDDAAVAAGFVHSQAVMIG